MKHSYWIQPVLILSKYIANDLKGWAASLSIQCQWFSHTLDCESYTQLWDINDNMEISSHLERIMSCLYADQESNVINKYEGTEQVEIRRVKCCQSRMCTESEHCNIYSEDVMRDALDGDEFSSMIRRKKQPQICQRHHVHISIKFANSAKKINCNCIPFYRISEYHHDK